MSTTYCSGRSSGERPGQNRMLAPPRGLTPLLRGMLDLPCIAMKELFLPLIKVVCYWCVHTNGDRDQYKHTVVVKKCVQNQCKFALVSVYVDTVEGVCNGFLALYTFFWFPEFSGYHQWQQESQ